MSGANEGSRAPGERLAKGGRLLIVAGSDAGGGAGIQADIKTSTVLGAFAMTAVTALTAQNTKGVHGVVGVEPAFVKQQIDVVWDDLGVDAVKTGMLHDTPIIDTVVAALKERAGDGAAVVVDPVMVAKGGARLLQRDAEAALRERLLPLATLITPNTPEAEALLGRSFDVFPSTKDVASALLELGPQAVLLKGGHRPGDIVEDLLLMRDGFSLRLEAPRQRTSSTHGTGCTLASAIAAGLAMGAPLVEAVQTAHRFVQEALRHAPGLGHGHGPLGHARAGRALWAADAIAPRPESA